MIFSKLSLFMLYTNVKFITKIKSVKMPTMPNKSSLKFLSQETGSLWINGLYNYKKLYKGLKIYNDFMISFYENSLKLL